MKNFFLKAMFGIKNILLRLIIFNEVIVDRYCGGLELGTGLGGLKDSLRIGSVCCGKRDART